MRIVHRSTLTAATVAAFAVLGLSACSSDSSTAAPEATAAANDIIGDARHHARDGRASGRT